MAASQADDYREWRQGAVIIVAMLIGAAIGGGAFYLADIIPYGYVLGAVVGAVVVFLLYSYFVFGR